MQFKNDSFQNIKKKYVNLFYELITLSLVSDTTGKYFIILYYFVLSKNIFSVINFVKLLFWERDKIHNRLHLTLNIKDKSYKYKKMKIFMKTPGQYNKQFTICIVY